MKAISSKVIIIACAIAVSAIFDGSVSASQAVSDDAYMSHMQRGAALVGKRRNEEALDAFKRAVQAEPQSLDACFNVGNLARKLKRCDDVLLYFTSFLYLSPGTEDDLTAKKAISECVLESKGSGFSIKADQPGFEVLVNGLVFGKTPIAETEMMPGKYQVLIARNSPDFEEVVKTVEVVAGKMTVVDVVLPRKVTYGFMQVATTPVDGVDVYLEEKFIGKTPIEKIRLESAKKHFLRLEMSGFDSWIRNVVVVRDKTTTVTAVLEKTKGESGAVERAVPDQVGVNGK